MTITNAELRMIIRAQDEARAFLDQLQKSLVLPGRCSGGPASPCSHYMVGEEGPEIFVPSRGGAIAPDTADQEEAD